MWRYFSEDRVSDYFGLAADETMALRVGKNQSLPILRLYTYRSNSALVGRFQRIENELNLNFCETQGISVNRRLQAQVYYKGLACSMKQARQLVTHGQICIGDQKVTIPSYPVTRDEEELIRYHPRSKLNDENHVIRQTILGVRESAEYAEEEVDPEFSQSEASDVNESADDAPKAEDTVAGGGE